MKKENLKIIEEGKLEDLYNEWLKFMTFISPETNVKEQYIPNDYLEYIKQVLEKKLSEGYKYYAGELYFKNGVIGLNPWISKDDIEYEEMFTKSDIDKLQKLSRNRFYVKEIPIMPILNSISGKKVISAMLDKGYKETDIIKICDKNFWFEV